MSLRASDALADGFDDLLSRRGGVLTALWVVFGLVNAVAFQTVMARYFEWVFETLEVSPEEIGQQPGPFGAAGAEAGGGELSPLALDVSVSVAVVLVVLVSVAGIALRIVAIRTFAADGPDLFPPDVGRSFGRTVAYGVLASLFVGVSLLVGFAMLVLPGLVLAVLFYFVMQAVALDDEGPLSAVRTSVGLVTDNLLAVVVLLVVTVVAGFVLALPVGVLPVPAVVGEVLSAVVNAVVNVFGIAVATGAYRRATGDGPTDRLAEF